MADEEQLQILEQGVEVWNRWRGANPAVAVDLKGADLREANLSGVALWGADLSELNASKVDLTEANLRKANLSKADLSKADLREAKLWGVDLSKANLSETNLNWADLQQADLREANLSQAHLVGAELCNSMLNGANLSRTDLTQADLNTAYLWGADLSEARLWEANLRRAYLPEANLSGASLGQVDLSEADLREANLSGANLLAVNLGGADLSGVDLTRARLFATTFAGVDLSRTKGLEEVQHLGPSTMGIDTIQRTGQRIPETFLRGCGLSDLDLEYSKLADHHLTPKQMTGILDSIRRLHARNSMQRPSCFISYSSQDEEFVQLLHNDLQDRGIRSWFPPGSIKLYSLVSSTIRRQMRQRSKLLIVLSEASVKMREFEFEVDDALDAEERSNRLVLVPIRLDRAVMTTGDEWTAKIRRRRIGDFTRWQDKACYQEALDQLLRVLESA